MKILLVRPKPSPETIGLQHVMIVEPLELEILYTLKRDSDTAIIIDLILEKKPFEWFLKKHQPDVLCLTGYITNVGIMMDYCRIAKLLLPSVRTVVGGVHCEVCPEDFEDESIDFRVVRNASVTFTDLLNHIEFGREIPKGIFKREDTLETYSLPAFDFRVPIPDRSSVSNYRPKYFYIFHEKVALLKASFGCPYQCSFCFCRVITHGAYYQRPIAEVMEELEGIHETEIYIVDDDFLADRKYLQSFIDEVKRRNIHKHYLVYGRADFIASNAEIIHQMAEIGLKTVIVGFESFSDKELAKYNKNTSVAMYAETMTVLKRDNIDVFATIIVPPEWDRSDFKNMVRVVKSLGIHYVNLQPLTPLPKTEVSYPEDQLLLSRKDYEKWDLAHISVQPEKMTVPEFYQEILKAYSAILYQPKVMWRYLTTYRPTLLWKMIVGGARVAKQYQKKINEAKKHA